jgi:hypothetical protein
MRFNLRLHGRTAGGKPCQADITVYANSQSELQKQASEAAATAAWRGLEKADDWIPDGEHIVVERVESLDR